MSLVEKAKSKFQQLYASSSAAGIRVVTRAPGRVNLIGDHTDYNQGLVLPMNISREAVVVAQRRKDEGIQVYSLDFDERINMPVTNLQYRAEDGWANYVKATLASLQNHGHRIEPMNLVVGGNIPQGSGLSSSAALEAAVARAASALCGFPWDPLGVSKALQHGENSFIGVKSGLMDPLCVTAAKPGHALFLDCRDNTWEDIPVAFDDAAFVVIDSGVSRSLKTSAYNERRSQCEEGLALLKAKSDRYQSLRDVGVIAFERHKKSLPQILRKRVEHVVFENDRVKQAAQALKSGDSQAFGALMNKSHRSLSGLFDVSTDAIDSLVAYAVSQPEVLGSRLTGGGFGGCTVNLVKKDQLESFSEKTKRWFSQKRGMKATVIPCVESSPASELESEEPFDLASLGLG
jgi:galactokinase